LVGPLDVDSAYYLLAARSLASASGGSIPAFWLFFHPPPALPQTLGELWLPMPSLLLQPFLLLGSTFRHAQVGQVVLAALIPVLSLRIALDLGLRPRWAGAAALFVLLSGTVTVHWVDTDCFTAFALLGGGALWAMGRATFDRRFLFLAGSLGGLAALTRNDGLLLLPVLCGFEWLLSHRQRIPFGRWPFLASTALFLLPPALWAVRNLAVFGTPSPVPLPYLATLLDYNQLFRWQPQVDWAAFLHQGWDTFAGLRIDALRAAFTVLLANLQIWGLVPLIAVAGRVARRPILWPPFLYLGLLLVTLVGAFPLLVTHGTWSRSISAFLPAGAATVAAGCSDAERWLERRIRGRASHGIRGVLLLGVVLLTALVGATALVEHLRAASRHPLTWQEVARLLEEVERSGGTVMAQDPMGVLVYAGYRAIGIPHEELPQLLEIARRYDVRTLVLVGNLQERLPEALRNLYRAGESQEPGFTSGPFVLLRRKDEIQVYELR
jgi:hypothetical protein